MTDAGLYTRQSRLPVARCWKERACASVCDVTGERERETRTSHPMCTVHHTPMLSRHNEVKNFLERMGSKRARSTPCCYKHHPLFHSTLLTHLFLHSTLYLSNSFVSPTGVGRHYERRTARSHHQAGHRQRRAYFPHPPVAVASGAGSAPDPWHAFVLVRAHSVPGPLTCPSSGPRSC
jgi:hypothetical protein